MPLTPTAQDVDGHASRSYKMLTGSDLTVYNAFLAKASGRIGWKNFADQNPAAGIVVTTHRVLTDGQLISENPETCYLISISKFLWTSCDLYITYSIDGTSLAFNSAKQRQALVIANSSSGFEQIGAQFGILGHKVANLSCGDGKTICQQANEAIRKAHIEREARSRIDTSASISQLKLE